jgi:hypothetical protein
VDLRVIERREVGLAERRAVVGNTAGVRTNLERLRVVRRCSISTRSFGAAASTAWPSSFPKRRRANNDRHRVCADSMSLNAIATPAAREPRTLVTRWRSLSWRGSSTTAP